MSASMCMKIVRVSSIVIKLVDDTQRNGPNNFYRECWEEIFSVDRICSIRPYEVGHYVNEHRHHWCNDKIT